ncbi:hypothetical protein [Francisella hispaniensis]|uniref:Acid phosphatase n=1 Tax=Francisella hispaniensis FSC454 TaxID=1088883 RepID=A0AAC9J747_9GAMM|nr:hypothetical protein [Francisella hispaniensis]APD50617.1 hypothetical protein FSC454_05520 [Francisella hispaniensis FSC454]
MKKLKNTIKAIFLLSLGSTIIAACSNKNNQSDVNPLELYSKVTQLEDAFDEQYGDTFKLPENAKKCVANITKNSDVLKYMNSKNGYDYNHDSQYAKNAKKLVDNLNNLISEFKQIGFIKTIEKNGKHPDIMFDIDNTLELTSFNDDYDSKGTKPTPYITDFVKKQCFKDGVDCYFITARYCNTASATTTAKWLKKNLNLTDNQIDKYVFLSGSIENSLCASTSNDKVAYKDSFRQALSEQRNVYWLMSIGDQMTDWYGSHSGLKVKFPNQLFQSNIVPNNYDNPSNCMLMTVTAPTQSCYDKLKSGILEHGTINYCKNFKENKYYNGN